MSESNNSSHPKAPRFSSTQIGAVLRIALIFVVYVLAFIVLDLSAHAVQVFPGIVAWYPPDGLSFAFLLIFGVGFLPAVAIASIISSFFVFQLSLAFSPLFGWAIFISLIYGLTAWFLRQKVRLDTRLHGPRDLFWMIVSTAVVSMILAAVSVSASVDSGVVPEAERIWAMIQWWVGEMIGVLVVTPALLFHVMPRVQRFVEGESLLQKTQISFRLPTPWVIMQAISIAASIYLAVDVSWPNDFHPFFLVAIPLVWIAIQHGLSGASIGNIIVNFGITGAVQGHPHFNLVELGQLQLLMLAMSIASLLIGIIASENRRLMDSPLGEMARQRKKVVDELIIISVAGMAAWVLEYTFDFYEAITGWETRHQIKGVDETLVAIAVLGLASAVFSYRRWKEVQIEIRGREKAQTELQALYRELETRVQKRTADLSKANELLQTEINERKQVEASLKTAEAKYRTLVEQLPAIAYIVEFGETIQTIYISPQVESILGFSTEEWLADRGVWVNQLHPEDRDRVLGEFALRDKLREPIDIDYRILTRDGRVRWIHDQSVLILDDNGNPRYAHGLIFDITERKQAEEALEQSERRFRALVEHSLEEVSLVSTDGTLIYESPSMRRPLGYTPGSFIGSNLLELFHPDDKATAIKLLTEIIVQPGSYREAVFRLRHRDSTWRWMEGIVTNLLDEPAVRAIVINYRDVTERKQAERALRESEQKFRLLFATSPDAIVLIDPQNTSVLWPIVDCNDAAGRMNGYTRAELIGQSIDILNIAPGTPEERISYLEHLRREEVIHTEAFHRHKDGHIFPVEISTSVFAFGGRELVLGIERDITERRQAEEEMRTLTDELLALYALSRALAEADNLEEILELVNRHAVESIHTTFARIALLEGDNFVIQAAYPVRVLDRELLAGNRVPVTALPHCKRAMEQNEPLILSAGDPALSSSERAALLLDFAQSICLVPLRSSGHEAKSKYAMGLLMLGEARSERRETFSPAKVRLAQSIGEQTAIAIRRMLLQGQTERRLQHLTALREIDQAIASSFGLRVSLDTLLTQVINQLSIDAASVWLFNFESNTLEFSAGRGFRTTVFEKAKPLRLGEGYAGRAALEGRTIHISDLVAQQDNPRLMRALAGEEFVSYYGIPLIARESVQGVLEVFHRTTLEPDEDWLGFLNTLAGQAAIAIDNATLFDNLLRSNYQLNQAYDATIEGWSAALDLRDKETEGHTQRVTEMTIKLAKVTGFSKQELIQVRRGALLHDIGKMGVPDSILLKPDKLTDEEWVIMRMHPTYAYQMLEPITYLGPALEIPYCHHEKWDGTGYPRRLKGEQIPFAARIFAIVDVYDALTSDRPYRKGWSREKTLEHIRELSGSHFDPRVVDAFFKMVDEGI